MYLIGIDLQFGVGAGGHPFPRSLHLVKFELSKESKQGLNRKDVFLGEISSEKRLYKGSTKAHSALDSPLPSSGHLHLSGLEMGCAVCTLSRI